MFRLKLFGNEVDDSSVPVNAAQVHVASSCNRVVVTVGNFHHGHVERTAAQVIYQHAF